MLRLIDGDEYHRMKQSGHIPHGKCATTPSKSSNHSIGKLVQETHAVHYGHGANFSSGAEISRARDVDRIGKDPGTIAAVNAQIGLDPIDSGFMERE